MNADTTSRRFARYFALPIVAAGIIGGAPERRVIGCHMLRQRARRKQAVKAST